MSEATDLIRARMGARRSNVEALEAKLADLATQAREVTQERDTERRAYDALAVALGLIERGIKRG